MVVAEVKDREVVEIVGVVAEEIIFVRVISGIVEVKVVVLMVGEGSLFAELNTLDVVELALFVVVAEVKDREVVEIVGVVADDI